MKEKVNERKFDRPWLILIIKKVAENNGVSFIQAVRGIMDEAIYMSNTPGISAWKEHIRYWIEAGFEEEEAALALGYFEYHYS